MSTARVLEMESLTMPANVEAERTILGAILLDPKAYIEAAQTLSRGDFYSVANGLLFVRMGQMVEASKPIDTVTLTEELARRREIFCRRCGIHYGPHQRIAATRKYCALRQNCEGKGSAARPD